MKAFLKEFYSKNFKDKIVTYNFMEEQFLLEGYVSSNYVYKILYKITNFKIIKIVISYFFFFKRIKFIYNKPKKTDIIIFDCETKYDLECLLKYNNYQVLSTRTDSINQIYFCKEVFFPFIKNVFKFGLKNSYLISFIKVSSPKIVITNIMMSENFHIISNYFKNIINFIIIQKGFIYEMSDKNKNNFFAKEIFVYGEYDKLWIEKNNLKVEKISVVGSLKSSLCNDFIKKNNINIQRNKYDICLISELHAQLNGDFDDVDGIADCIGQIALFTIKLCKKFNLKLVFTGEGDGMNILSQREISFYKHYLKDHEFKIFQGPRRHYPSYRNVIESNLTIGYVSTLLRESFSYKKKILSCDFLGSKRLTFPGTGIKLKEDSLFILKGNSYEEFEKRVISLLKMSNKDYFNRLGSNVNFIMFPKTDTTKAIRKKINNLLV